MAVQARLFEKHPYGRPVLGTRDELLATGHEELRAFHGRFYRPDNAVLVVAGDAGDEAFEEVERRLGDLPAGAARRAASSPPASWPDSLVRVERRKGEVARLMLALPAPDATHPDHPALRLLTTLLAGGRVSRLHHALVEDEQLCSWLAADLTEGMDASQITLTAEVVPGVEPAKIEERLLGHLEDLLRHPAGLDEVERARQIAFADWVFAHERVHQQALSAGLALALFDLDYIDRHMGHMLATSPDRLHEIAARYLRPERGGILGWSLPRAEG
jgi:zinc protease